MEIPQEYKKNLYRAILTLLVVLSLYFAVSFLSEWRSYGMMGSGGANTITLTGHGEVQAVPDIANVYFSIRKDAKTVKEAQDAVALVEKAALEFLKTNDIADKDIQTTNASFYPKYEYVYESKAVICTEFYCPPRPGKNVIVGYESSESITVKVRNTDDAGKIIQGLGALGVSDLNGPNFAVDNEEELKAEARKEAIEEARKKAKVLAKDLGVSLGRIASFSETGFYPMYYGKAMNSVDAVV
ncbi:SIMPL domain-containing protein [Candidatus Nomurabacteria bacterium]|nr:SIMPL domain-containing protein [Candidatus Nomurabacteria bacterium]